MGEPLVHETASVFAFARFGTAWRMCVVAHPRLGGHLAPGGHLEPGETAEQAAMREVLEETGLRVRLLPRALPEGYPHRAVPAAWHVVDMPAAPDSRSPVRHTHRDHLFVAAVDRPFATVREPEHQVRWADATALAGLDLPHDTLVFAAHLLAVIEAAASEPGPLRRSEALRAELLHRQEADQAVRRTPAAERTPAFLARWQAVDRENSAWLREVIDRHGWPGRAMVGCDGALAAWLLAQHADHDPGFQEQCLDLLARAVTAGDADPKHGALLEDRVRLARGLPQVFGTQLAGDANGPLVLRPTEDLDGLDERRGQWGFEPIRDYIVSVRANMP